MISMRLVDGDRGDDGDNQDDLEFQKKQRELKAKEKAAAEAAKGRVRICL